MFLQCGAQRKPNDKVLLHFFSCSPCNRWRKWSGLEQTSNTVENDHLGEIHIKWMDGWYQVMKIKIKSTHPPLLLYDTLVTGMSFPINCVVPAVRICFTKMNSLIYIRFRLVVKLLHFHYSCFSKWSLPAKVILFSDLWWQSCHLSYSENPSMESNENF